MRERYYTSILLIILIYNVIYTNTDTAGTMCTPNTVVIYPTDSSVMGMDQNLLLNAIDDEIIDFTAGTNHNLGLVSYHENATVEIGYTDMSIGGNDATVSAALFATTFSATANSDWSAGLATANNLANFNPTPDFIIIITSADPTDLTAATNAANSLKGNGAQILAVGIGSVMESNLQSISGPEEDVDYVQAADFTALGVELDTFTENQVCCDGLRDNCGICNGNSTCDDGDPCTENDVCDSQGTCAGTQIVCPSTDDDQCTIDECENGVCVNNPFFGACDDGEPCTENDTCGQNGMCNGTAVQCDDGVFCDGVETCIENPNAPGQPLCIAGVCPNCTDNDPCTQDLCDPYTDQCDNPPLSELGQQCGFTNVGPCQFGVYSCNQTHGLFCFGSVDPMPEECGMDGSGNGIDEDCDGVVDNGCGLPCDFTGDCPPLECHTVLCVNNVCTYTQAPNGTVCDDGFGCTSNDTCIEGECSGTLDCDDGNDCTDDICNPFDGECGNFFRMGPCDDGDACTFDDSCQVKNETIFCMGIPQTCDDFNQCTNNTCNSLTGECVFINVLDTTPCDDGDECTLDDQCINGNCTSLSGVDCDDQELCTDDLCIDMNGAMCVHKYNNMTCDDQNACTTNDMCVRGDCTGLEIVNCDDSDPCTMDVCDVLLGCQNIPINGTIGSPACDDQDLCTKNDRCINGECIGEPVICNDNNNCTDDMCMDNACMFIPLTGTLCDDGDPCTIGDTCVNGTCIGTPMNCTDGNICSTDVCIDGECFNFENSVPCDDNNVCTLNDTCNDFTCQGTANLDCDDANECTSEVCNPLLGCIYTNLTGTVCDDLDPCTLNDTCVNGQCVGTPMNCTVNTICTDDFCLMGQCVHAFNTLPCDDGDPCTNDTCSGGICVPGPPMNCDDSNVCTDDYCDPINGCQNDPLSDIPCDDGDPCTVSDNCVNGTCIGTPMICNDGDPCTNDYCNSTMGCCMFDPISNNQPGICSDNNACTIDDICVNGTCIGTPKVCNDNNTCTTDVCLISGQCAFINNNTISCDDGDPCTINDICINGDCIGTAKDCNDNNTCTTDTCNTNTGECMYLALLNDPCNDGDACTLNDTCNVNGECEGVPMDCNDNDTCTVDMCHNGKCFHSFMNMTCDDGDPCTFNDICNTTLEICAGTPIICTTPDTPEGACNPESCVNGTCVAIPSLMNTPCDDGDNCTINDVCTNVNGTMICVGTPLVCDDGLFCNGMETCENGFCVSSPPPDCDDSDFCTYDQCNFAQNQCVNSPIPIIGQQCGITDVGICEFGVTTCNSTDGSLNCTGAVFPAPMEICGNGLDDNCNGVVDEGCGINCVTVLDCPDLLPCSTVACINDTCVYTPTTNPCDDGDLCTVNDTCTNGICIGTPMHCDDQNPCTDDMCIVMDNQGMCLSKANNNATCDDSNPCTLNDHCVNSWCTGTPMNCDDANICTDDFCNVETGTCFYAHNTDICDDGDICTTMDRCQGGQCVGFTVVCNDNNICTTDSCNPNTGMCDFVDNNDPCDDGDICTENDACNNGVCAGTPKDCDDFDVCTEDTCDPYTGNCTNTNVVAICDDGDPCTLNDLCNPSTGQCEGVPKPCDDGNHCTTNTCEPNTGNCLAVNNTKPCDDGDPCTYHDTCMNGQCVGMDIICDDQNVCTTDTCVNGTCVYSFNSISCDDGDICTLNDVCINVAGGAPTCVGTEQNCDDGNPCTDDMCDTQTGNCTNIINSNPNTVCSDGDLCTHNDRCINGQCVGTPINCDDGNTCTNDLCLNGGCLYVYLNNQTCDDGNPCTVNDTCVMGFCIGEDIQCEDNNTCTTDFCDVNNGQCVFQPCLDGMSCDDGDPCTVLDQCVNGTCVGTPKVCSDGNFCNGMETCNITTGACMPGIIPNCTDGDPCTQDICDNNLGMCLNPPVNGNGTQCGITNVGACEFGVFVCNGTASNETNVVLDCIGNIDPVMEICNDTIDNDCDGLVDEGCGQICETVQDCPQMICNDVICNMTTNMCEHTHNNEYCDDGDVCTDHDQCNDGICIGTPIVCDDNEICTMDSCNSTTGLCQNVPVVVPCDDGNACTINDHCLNGTCTGTPFICDDNNPCTIDKCIDMGGIAMCFTTNDNNATCSDGDDCTLNDRCVDGDCISDTMECNDENICTDDQCVNGACQFTNNTVTCDDMDACTINDRCINGVCQGIPKNCTDHNPCTDDSCDAMTGQCIHTNNTLSCDDLDPCTINDICVNATCVGTPKDCNDNNNCTTDNCNVNNGVCQNIPAPGMACDDGDSCTFNDTCNGVGQCIGMPIICNDNNTCTDDVCRDGECCHDPNGNLCDDGDPCTVDDTCYFGFCLGTDMACDDANECTLDLCEIDPNTTMPVCMHFDVSNILCDDGDPCTENDICVSGVCVGTPKDCDDNDPCTDDVCDSNNGMCFYTHNTDPCDDGDLCTDSDTCNNGVCAGTPIDCNMLNICTTGSCNPSTGLCDAANNTLPCDDGNNCTINDICTNAQCIGTLIDCDDGNPCTNDTCNPMTGMCDHFDNMLPCDDGNPCTLMDMCLNGICIGMPNSCSDNNDCTDDACDKYTGECTHTNNDYNACKHPDKCIVNDRCLNGTCIGDPKDCNDGNICTTNVCDTDTGNCVPVSQNVTCDDLNPCTLNDTCTDGVCAGTPIDCDDSNPCTEDFCFQANCYHIIDLQAECDDGNPCTDNECVAISTGSVICESTPNSNICDDGNPCSLIDICMNGTCTGTNFLDCNDGDDCTLDICNTNNGTCSNILESPGTPCDDGDPCTENDVCDSQGGCSGVPKDCNDEDVCTGNTCDPNTGNCIAVNNTAPCDDGDPCTHTDQCNNGVCAGIPIDCGNSTQCLNRTCNPSSGICESIYLTGPCDDGDNCTINDKCIHGECIGVNKTCEVTQCTTGICEPETGDCESVSDGAPCDDGDACTLNDECINGICTHNSTFNCDNGDLCRHNICVDMDGDPMCFFKHNSNPCDDNNMCTTNDTCTDGICSGTPTDCNDQNICTDDSCDPSTGNCINTNNNAPCDDLDACTENDVCSGGVCQGTPKDCDGGNPCRDYFCVPGGMCMYTPKPDNTSCVIPGNLCAENNVCVSGNCVVGNLKNCTDGDICTDDTCDPDTGNCIPINNNAQCDDGDPCTFGDMCVSGSCTGIPIDCNDNNPCTLDICSPNSGCTHVNLPNNTACDDGQGCTVGDTCQEGTDGTSVCEAGPEKNCTDQNPCTDDFCDYSIGDCKIIDNMTPCDDGDLCTVTDLCMDGSCEGEPKDCDDSNPCTLDACDEFSGNCTNTPLNGTDCSIGHKHGVCVEGECMMEEKHSILLILCIVGGVLGVLALVGAVIAFVSCNSGCQEPEADCQYPKKDTNFNYSEGHSPHTGHVVIQTRLPNDGIRLRIPNTQS